MSNYTFVIGVVLSFASTLHAAEPQQLAVGEGKVISLAFSPDGKQLAVGTSASPPAVKVFDLAAKKELRDLPCEGRGAPFSIAYSPDGKLLAIGDYGLAVTVRSALDGAEVASLPGDPQGQKYRQARRLAFLPDGKSLAVGYSTGEIYRWDVVGKHVVSKFDHASDIAALACSPDARLIATGTNYGLRLWDVASGKALVSLDQQSSGKHQVQAIAFTPDAKTVITADSPGFVRFFSVADGKELGTYKMPSVGGETTIAALAITPDGRTAVVPGLMSGLDPARPQNLTDGLVLLDIATFRPRSFLASIPARVLSLSPDGKTAALATGESGDPVFHYDLSAGVTLKP